MDISLDKLNHKAKASLVGGNRKMVRNQLYESILHHIVDRLNKDDALKYWEEQFASRRIVREVVDEELSRRLGDKIDTFLNRDTSSIKLTGATGSKRGGSDKKEEPKKKDLPLLPTRIICEPPRLFCARGQVKVSQLISMSRRAFATRGNSLELIWENDTEGVSTSTGSLKMGIFAAISK